MKNNKYPLALVQYSGELVLTVGKYVVSSRLSATYLPFCFTGFLKVDNILEYRLRDIP